MSSNHFSVAAMTKISAAEIAIARISRVRIVAILSIVSVAPAFAQALDNYLCHGCDFTVSPVLCFSKLCQQRFHRADQSAKAIISKLWRNSEFHFHYISSSSNSGLWNAMQQGDLPVPTTRRSERPIQHKIPVLAVPAILSPARFGQCRLKRPIRQHLGLRGHINV